MSLPCCSPPWGGVAFLYAAVGHAGASGYIAVMSLAGLPAEMIRPTALVLNVAVAALGSWQFIVAGHLNARRFWPLLVLSIPAAFLGGALSLPDPLFRRLVAVVLLVSAVRFVRCPRDPSTVHPPGAIQMLATGGALGLLAGLSGTGGGVFLTPLMLLRRWCRTREAAAVSVVFILVNSLAGLAGFGLWHRRLADPTVPMLAVVALAGGVGAHLGSRHLPVPMIRRCLAAVVALAGMKLLLGA